jgi:CubicO group peptidase (beta-lactamase class C family)
VTQFERTIGAVQQALDRAPYAGVQVHVWSAEGPEFGYAAGMAGNGRQLHEDSVVRWLSASKPVVSVAIAQLWQAGSVSLDEPVRRYLPEMRQPDVTVRHLLTHTAGFRDDPPKGALVQHWEAAVEQACASDLEEGWRPGRMATYSTWTAFLLLGEVVRRVDGRSLDKYLRAEVFDPLGMDDCHFAMSPDTYAEYGERVADLVYVTPDGPLADPLLNDPTLADRCWPALGLRGPACQVTRLFRALLPGGAGDVARLLEPPTVEAISLRQFIGIRYRQYLRKVSWGLGMLAGPEMFGPYCSERTFGGRGRGSSVLFADPHYRLVVAAAWTGMLEDEGRHGARVRELSAAVYEDLDLAVQVRPPVAPGVSQLQALLAAANQTEQSAADDLDSLLRSGWGLDDEQLTRLVEQLGGPDRLLAYFREALASSITAERARPGTVLITLVWDEGELCYRLDIRDDGTIVLDQSDAAALAVADGLRLTLAGCDLTRLLSGELDVKTALSQRRLKVGGDVSLVSVLMAAFSGSVFAIGTP